MSQSSSPQPENSPVVPPQKSGFSLVNVVMLVVPLLAIVGIMMYALANPSQRRGNIGNQVQGHFAKSIVVKLDPEYQDADGDLVADTPAQVIDPPKLVFLTLEANGDVWKGFCEFLGKRVQRPVEWRHEPWSLQDLTGKFKEGSIHLASLSTGTVPTLVNAAGFVPAVCMADDKKAYEYHAVILVHASSPVKKLSDLKGRRLTLTSISSLSSFKAGLLALGEEGLQMGKDYEVGFAPGQRDAIAGLAEKRYEAIAVASDLLDRTVKSKKLDASQFRTIHESKDGYPPACFGYHHTLKKELADEIRKAFLEYTWDTRMQEEFAPAGYVQFVPVTYKKDWEAVRKMDEKIKGKGN